MRIRTVLIAAFLIATLVPSVIFGWWSYRHGIEREFAEVNDRHLLLAQNLGKALERYHRDVVGTFDSISASLIAGHRTPNLQALMSSINLICVLIVDGATGQVVAKAEMDPKKPGLGVPSGLVETAKSLAKPGVTSFSQVLHSEHGGNVMLGVRRYGERIAVAIVSTDYFVELGNSIAFGKKGHAAIVDRMGNVLAHPLPSWVAERKNIAKVPAVARMMAGETGIETFYSPALKGDMIAGLTAVPGPGWGVMIPQPVQEIYDKIYENNKAVLMTLATGLAITIGFVLLFVNSLAAPLERLLRAMKANGEDGRMAVSPAATGLVPLTEVTQFHENYNDMVLRVSEANDKIVAMAYSDGVTDLPNREGLQQLAEDALNFPSPAEAGGALVFIDLDDFKLINDMHGHDVGDAFLRDCAAKLQRTIRDLRNNCSGRESNLPNPVIARIGGDEFAILYPGLVDEDETKQFLDLLKLELSTPSEELPFITKRNASIGCSRYPEDGRELEELIKFADIAMYHAKRCGKNRAEIYSKKNGTMTASELRFAVGEAIVNNELVLEYQPKVSASDHKVVATEALVRWDHPTLGRIPPNQWIPAISNSLVIKQLGEWVVSRAMDDHRTWTQAGLDMKVAVNVGSEHFSSPDFTEFLARSARAKGFDANDMEIEITEDALFSTETDAEAVISRVHGLGYKIAIDDFGTGYSNIARLCKLPVDCLKIDRSVISQANNNERVASMMDCIVLMAKKLGCETVAEGIETSEDAGRSRSYGVNTLQGFLFSPSLPVEDLIDWARNQNGTIRSRDPGGRKSAAA